MSVDQKKYLEIVNQLQKKNVRLVAVSKTKPVEDIMELYELGQRDFGENYVQELLDKKERLPKDIRWHYIGHLQTNKVKFIVPFIYLIHGIDSFKLLKEVDKQALKQHRRVDVLLQAYIATEESKFGMDENELNELFSLESTVHRQLEILTQIRIMGLMGMASFTSDMVRVRSEFQKLRDLFERFRTVPTANAQLSILSMGMSNDYATAIEEGSTMVRIGSLLFGERK